MNPLFSKKQTPSVFCLLLCLLAFISPLFAQNAAIETAEKNLAAAKLDSLNTPQYAAALKGLWQAYSTYIDTLKKEMPDTLTITLVTKDAAYRRVMDSLVTVAGKVKKSNIGAFQKKIQEKEQGLYRDMVGSLDSIATFYSDIKSDYGKTLPLVALKKALSIKLGDKEAYFKNEYDRGVAYKHTSSFDTAQTVLEAAIKDLTQEINDFEVLSNSEKVKSKNLWLKKSRSIKIDLLTQLGQVYGEKGNFDSTVFYMKQAVADFKQAVKDTFNIIEKLTVPHYYLSGAYLDNSLLDSAQVVIEEGFTFFKPESAEYGYLRHKLGLIYNNKGQMFKANELALKDYELYKNDKRRAASSATTLFMGNFKLGRYGEALKWLDIWVTHSEKEHGKGSYLGEAMPRHLKGVLYRINKNHEKAKYNFERAIEIIESTNLEKSQTTSTYQEYAWLLEDLGQYEQSLAIKQKTHKDALTFTFENSRSRAVSWGNLGQSYLMVNKLDAALDCYKQSLELHKKGNFTQSEDYAANLINISKILERKHQYSEAEITYREAMSIVIDSVKIKDEYRSAAMFRFSNLLRKQAKYAEAINLSNQAMLLLRGGDFYQKAQLNRVLLHENQRENTQAVDSLNSLFQGIQLRIDKEFGYLYEKEKTAFMSMLDQDLFGTMQAAFARLYLKGEAARSGALFYNTLLLQKELSVLDTRSLKYKSFLSGDSVLQEQVYKIGFWQDKAVEKGVSNAEQAKISENIATLKTAIETKHPQFFEKNALGTTWQTVQKQLKPDEIAIEFADVLNNDDDTTSRRNYYALVIKADSKYPSVIPLFEEKELVKLLDETRFYKHDSKTNVPISSDEETVKRRYDTTNGKKLYNLIWKPLENAQILRGVQTVHFAPSGLLNRVAFAALPVGGNLEKLLLHTYALRQYNSTRALVETTSRPAALAKDLVAFGNIQYGNCGGDTSKSASIETIPLEKSDGLVARSALFLDSVTIHWPALPNSKREIDSLAQSHKKYQPNATFTAFTGYNASEARFKTLGTGGKSSPSHLYISTHGYGNPTNYPESRYASAALHRAGLVMATANWTTECPIKRDIEAEDGILTAYEIAQLNLSNTELVVLSGCQTGLGDIWGREGVFGLTRGFKLAGVNHIIASLWEVPDKDTADFMTTFYDLYLSGKSITKAFEDTQKAMQQEQSVYSWGAWVLIK